MVPRLYGETLNRRDLAARSGSLSQFAGVRLSTLGDGVERGSAGAAPATAAAGRRGGKAGIGDAVLGKDAGATWRAGAADAACTAPARLWGCAACTGLALLENTCTSVDPSTTHAAAPSQYRRFRDVRPCACAAAGEVPVAVVVALWRRASKIRLTAPSPAIPAPVRGCYGSWRGNRTCARIPARRTAPVRHDHPATHSDR